MSRYDERQEAIARIQMAVDNDMQARVELEAFEEELADDGSPSDKRKLSDTDQWLLRAPQNLVSSRTIADNSCDPYLRDFDQKLRAFLNLTGLARVSDAESVMVSSRVLIPPSSGSRAFLGSAILLCIC